MMPERNDNSNSANPDIFGESNRLGWLAFCYLADELTDAQRVDFETQLASDIDAQEALANAVALGRSVFETQRPMRATADVHLQSHTQREIVPSGPLVGQAGQTGQTGQAGQAGWRFWVAAASVLAVASMIALSVNSSDSQPVVAHRSIGGDRDVKDLATDGVAIESIDSWLTELGYFDVPADGNDALTTGSWDSVDDSADEVVFQDDEAMNLDGSLVAFYSDVLAGGESDAGESRNGVEL